MMNFEKKYISSNYTNVGDILKEARETLGYSIERVCRILKIRKEYLLAIEDQQFNKLPSLIYCKNFLRDYSSFLKLDPQKIDELFYGEWKLYENRFQQPKKVSDNISFNKNYKKFNKRLVFGPNFFKWLLIFFAVFLCCSYMGIEVKKMFLEPRLIIEQPKDNIITSDFIIEVKGYSEKEAKVFINNKVVYLNKEGAFSETIALQKGLNIIKISATKKYSKENIVYKQIIVTGKKDENKSFKKVLTYK